MNVAKPKRAANFSTNEKDVLMNLIQKYPVVTDKSTSNEMVQKKMEAWEEIRKLFSAHRFTRAITDVNELKNLYKNRRHRTRTIPQHAMLKIPRSSQQVNTAFREINSLMFYVCCRIPSLCRLLYPIQI